MTDVPTPDRSYHPSPDRLAVPEVLIGSLGSCERQHNYTERLAANDLVPSMVSRGDSYDNVLAETTSRLLQDRTRAPP